MNSEVVAFKSWLDAYGRAWESRSPEAASALFAENGTYQVTPFLNPLCGRKAIFQYWSEVARTEENIEFKYEILVANAELNIAKWSASFIIVPQTKLDGIFWISFDAKGRRTSLREWWHKLQE
jgi:hypothetical protein